MVLVMDTLSVNQVRKADGGREERGGRREGEEEERGRRGGVISESTPWPSIY